jgi:hypothetical protein
MMSVTVAPARPPPATAPTAPAGTPLPTTAHPVPRSTHRLSDPLVPFDRNDLHARRPDRIR